MSEQRTTGIRIPIPEPGETVEIHRRGLYILAVLDDSVPEPIEVEKPIGYTLVSVKAPKATVQHAAAMYQRAVRKTADRYTLCGSASKSPKLETRGRMISAPLEHVTCGRCRARLVALGEISGE